MQRFLRDCNAAVTVFVTLLLIPAILVSGTAVDLARIYTAKSIVQDANQLAANSVLASYEAMLQDLYGVFGVMQDDPILGGMLDEYIQVTVFGEDWKKTGSGTFQLFYGSNLQPAVVSPAREQNLRNVEVLRRQIEEYAKYRAPVVIVQDILDRIESFKKVKHDAEAIDIKMQIDSKIGEIDKLYRQIFSLIQEINGYQTAEDKAFGSINNILDEINQQLQMLRGTRSDYTGSFNAGDTEAAADHEHKYNAIKSNIRALIAGGTVLTQWQPGTPGSPGSPGRPGTPARPGVPATPAIPAVPATPATSGSWLGSRHSNGLTAAIGDGKSSLKTYKDKLDILVQKCTEADIKKQELSRLVDELDQKLNSGECTEELERKMGLLVADYRSLLKYELKKMAEAMQAKDGPYIDSVIAKLDEVSYGNIATNSPRISKENLQMLSAIAEYDIDFEIINRLNPGRPDPLTPLAGLGSSQYRYPVPRGFVLFQSPVFSSTDNPGFYSVLSLWYTSSSGSTQQQRDNATDNITGIIGEVQDFLEGLLVYDPDPGAEYYKPQSGESQGSFGTPGTGADEMASFGTDGNWDEEGVGMEKTREALGSSIFSQIGEAMGKVGDKILLLTYDSEMFSNWTTSFEEDPITMSGAPLGKDINYFYKSEQEYLIHGDAGNAAANLKAVAGLTLLVRFVFNYTSTFIVPEVKAEILEIKAMFTAVPPFAVFISELARVGYALCESAYDLSRLRNNKKVVLLKMDSADWTFSLKGLISKLAEPKGKGTAVSLSKQEDTIAVKNDEKGLSYSDYLKLYLLFVNGDTLAARTADLISLNMTNKKLGLEADEAAMAGAELFDLQKAITGFSIQSTVDLRMLFLSMPFAQKGVNGVVPPKTLPINVTDYRGY
ncbi:DUF5702 domain-containing protein [Paenibacillus sp. MMS20-IR301]|uniref:DUF5702 domain-containing protein n=1 Tax=Paenibacillus sp. MMS20-IR301 TaxID=2895946 RepID=UPI0028E25B72|nr:DUF5702 domain-containing protein [Paenibacillus sp. MMS20-IR301]WNS42903.1 DUF5702 domain-containing protein [Paenibacillus sp. MMS20-IR301]